MRIFNKFGRFVAALALGFGCLGAVIFRSDGAEIKARVVDGLGRPVTDVSVEIRLTEKSPEGKDVRVQRLKLSTDRSGQFQGTYDEKKISLEDIWVYVNKPGYETYSTGLRAEYVLQRKFGPRDIRRISRLTGEPQKSELKELLSGEFEREPNGEDLQELVFLYYRELAPSLRALLKDSKVGTKAAGALSFVGVPADLRLVVEQARAASPKKDLFDNRWAYATVTALMEPASESEWVFLKRCARGDYDDAWVESGAIQTLKLIASTRSRQVLQEVAKSNTNRNDEIADAVAYIDSKPAPLSAKDLVEAAKAVAQAIKIGDWKGNESPRFNDEGDMALINLEFVAGRDKLIYTATFHQVSGVWRFRGARETLQALMARPPDKSVFVGVWHGFSDSHLEFARLELKEDGTGLFALSELPDSPTHPYRVKKWSVQEYQLDILLEPSDSTAEPITLTNVTHGIGAIDLELHGTTWERKMTLLNEEEFMRRADEAKKSLEKISKSVDAK